MQKELSWEYMQQTGSGTAADWESILGTCDEIQLKAEKNDKRERKMRRFVLNCNCEDCKGAAT